MNNSCKHPEVQPFRHEATGTWSYVVSDPDTLDAVVIDPVMDFEYRSGRLYSCSADLLVDHVREHGLKVRAILETHAHADHVSAAPYLLGHWAVPLVYPAGNTVTFRARPEGAVQDAIRSEWQALDKDCNAVMQPQGRSRRASRKALIRCVMALGHGMAMTCEPCLAAKRFPTR